MNNENKKSLKKLWLTIGLVLAVAVIGWTVYNLVVGGAENPFNFIYKTSEVNLLNA